MIRLTAYLKNFLEKRAERRRLSAIPPLLIQDLEVLASSLRAGSSFMQALQVTAQEGEGPLAEEWNLVLREVQKGRSLAEALKHLEVRVPIPPIRSFASAVTIIQETGGNLAGVFLTLATTLREEMVFQGKLSAMTAQGRLSGYVVAAMPFVLMIALDLLAPEMMHPLFATPLGWMMLLAVVVMISIGMWMIQKIVTIEV